MNIYDIYKNPIGKIYADVTGLDIMSAIVTAVEADSKPEPEKPHYFYFEALQAGSTFKINSMHASCTYEYSNDEENWTNLGFKTITLENVGDRAYIRQSSNNGFWQTGYGDSDRKFITTGNLKVGGHISSLAYNDISHDKPNMKSTYSMAYIFNGCTAITDASDLKLDFVELTKSCYENMFRSCTSLTAAPELPATELAQSCYELMFYGCTSLTTAPELPATDIESASKCYQNMFNNCRNLNSITVHTTFWKAPSATNWVSGVSEVGTFTCPAELVILTGTNGIPEGWTRVDL